MKLNRMVLAAALVAGSLSVMACSKADDEDVASAPAGTDQVSAVDQGSTATAGVEQDARWGWGRGRGFAHAGWRRGDRDRDGRWGWRRWGRRDHDRDDRRAWWHRWW
jgi:hypothetical protein